MENWKKIKDYDYEISNLGNVRSLNRIVKCKIGTRKHLGINLKKSLNKKNGYVYVSLSNGKKQKKVAVHRLVAENFLENKNNLGYVNHKNEIKVDNRAENLEWCSFEYNMNYGKKIENHKKIMKGKFLGSKHPNSKPKEYYIENPVLKGNFKTTCLRMGWKYSDFKEVLAYSKKSKYNKMVNYYYYHFTK